MTQDVIKKGNLEYRKRQKSSGTYYQAVLVQCPVCGEKFNHGNDRIYHLRTQHTAADFGL